MHIEAAMAQVELLIKKTDWTTGYTKSLIVFEKKLMIVLTRNLKAGSKILHKLTGADIRDGLTSTDWNRIEARLRNLIDKELL